MNIQELRARRSVLEQMHDIPDLPLYADAWNVLAAEFDAVGMFANAENCLRRFRHYRDLDLAGYVRLASVSTVTAEIVA